jgi:phytoene dehydrogenase-like protein
LAKHYDVIVIGAGLGGLTAAALLARAGRKVLVLERNDSVGGAASTYKVGDLVVEASLHETADPYDPTEPKHQVLSRLGVLDAVQWVPTGPLYEVRGGPVGAAFRLPEGFPAARAALSERFPSARAGIDAVLGDMEQIAGGLGALSRGRDAFRNPREGIGALLKLGPVVRDWRRSLGEVFERAFGDDEAVKWALAANLAYYHDDPATLWWVFFAVAQGGYLASGGRYVRGGSQQLSNALARAIEAAGGEIATGRSATEIRLDASGRPSVVAHTDKKGSDRAEATTRAIAGNAAPAVLGEMLAAPARERFNAVYAERRLSISLFSAMFGLAKPPAECGFRTYSNFLLPSWIKRLADFPRCAELLGSAPAKAMDPLMTVVDYSAIDAGLGGPPYPVSVVGLDRVENWAGLDGTAYAARRRQWTDRIIEIVDREFPGFAANVVATTFSSAHSIRRYLNAPQGAIYGFAPLPPRGPIWHGIDRSPRTPIPGFYLASSYAGSGGFTGSIMGGAAAADRILAEH